MKFKLKDFPVGSIAYFYKIIDIQVNPKNRKSGDKKFIKGYVYSRIIINHHISNGKNEGGLVGTQYDNSNEGFDVENSRFLKEGFLLIPEFLYEDIKNRNSRKLTCEQKLITLLRDPFFSSEKINEIVLNTTIELQKPHSSKILYYQTKYKKNS